MFCTSSHETFDRDMRRFYDPQFTLAGEEGDELAKQKGHDACYLVTLQVKRQLNNLCALTNAQHQTTLFDDDR